MGEVECNLLERHKRIKELLVVGNMTKEEIAKAVNCGVATVYRVAKVI